MRSQWKIERVHRGRAEVTVRCQGDLNDLGDALDRDRVVFKDMVFRLSDPKARSDLTAIGRVVRGDVALPDERDPERWTGCEFVVDLTGPGQFRGTERAGRYEIWLPERARPLYDRWQGGDGAELRDPGVCVLGGGTVLASMWRHRESNDIDVFWPRGRWSDAELRERVERWTASLDEAPCRCDVGGGVAKVAWTDGDVDFIETDMLEHRSGRSRIARANVSVAGADEILAGKVHGRGLMAYRDIYDAAVCVLKAPRAWERAVELCVRRSRER